MENLRSSYLFMYSDTSGLIVYSIDNLENFTVQKRHNIEKILLNYEGTKVSQIRTFENKNLFKQIRGFQRMFACSSTKYKFFQLGGIK